MANCQKYDYVSNTGFDGTPLISITHILVGFSGHHIWASILATIFGCSVVIFMLSCEDPNW
jgi:hypothetical protein